MALIYREKTEQYQTKQNHENIDGLVQDCSISSALVMEILRSFTKPLLRTGDTAVMH